MSRPPKRPATDHPCVHVVGPSSPYDPKLLAAGLERLKNAGFVISERSGPLRSVPLRSVHAYLNGSDDDRRGDLESALADPDADIVWLARGGYGLTRIVESVSLPDEVPVVIGFSDVTALHARLANAGMRSIHGPLATSLATEPDASFQQTLALLRGEAVKPWALQTLLGDGTVDGPLFAANLSVLTHLVGTEAMPDLADRILILEEVGERPYRIDRMLTQLLSAGVLDRVAGMVLGRFSGCEEPAKKDTHSKAPSPFDVVAERLQTLSIPVATGLPCGHGDLGNHSFPLGCHATLRVNNQRVNNQRVNNQRVNNQRVNNKRVNNQDAQLELVETLFAPPSMVA